MDGKREIFDKTLNERKEMVTETICNLFKDQPNQPTLKKAIQTICSNINFLELISQSSKVDSVPAHAKLFLHALKEILLKACFEAKFDLANTLFDGLTKIYSKLFKNHINTAAVKTGDTLLHIATRTANVKIVLYLLQHNANPCLHNKSKKSSVNLVQDLIAVSIEMSDEKIKVRSENLHEIKNLFDNCNNTDATLELPAPLVATSGYSDPDTIIVYNENDTPFVSLDPSNEKHKTLISFATQALICITCVDGKKYEIFDLGTFKSLCGQVELEIKINNLPAILRTLDSSFHAANSTSDGVL